MKKVDDEVKETVGSKWYHYFRPNKKYIEIENEEKKTGEEISDYDDVKWYQCCSASEKYLAEVNDEKLIQANSKNEITKDKGVNGIHAGCVCVVGIDNDLEKECEAVKQTAKLDTSDLKIQLQKIQSQIIKTKLEQGLYSLQVKVPEHQTLSDTKYEKHSIANSLESFRVELSKSMTKEKELMNEIQSYRNQRMKLEFLEAELKEKDEAAEQENETILVNIKEERNVFGKKIEEKDIEIASLRNQNDILKESEKKYLEIISGLNYQKQLSCFDRNFLID